LNQICSQYIDANARTILYELGQKLDPSIVCSHFGICAAIKTEQKIEKSPSSGPVCQICTTVLGYAQNLLENNASETEIIIFIKSQLCAKLGPLNQICSQYVDANARTILYELGQKIDPSIVCSHFGICQSNLVKNIKPFEDTLNCTLCKLVFKQVVNELKNNATEAQLLSFIENTLCKHAGKLSPECKALIDQFGPTLIYELANGLDPNTLCQLIGMCHASVPAKFSKPSVELVQSIKHDNKIEGGEICIVCQYAVRFLETEIAKNATSQEIIAALDKVCLIAPSSLRDQCESIINSYGFHIIQLLIQLADPSKICEILKLCS